MSIFIKGTVKDFFASMLQTCKCNIGDKTSFDSIDLNRQKMFVNLVNQKWNINTSVNDFKGKTLNESVKVVREKIEELD